MIDLSSIVIDPRFAQTFIVKRKIGDWVGARWVETPAEIQMLGTISIANSKQIEFIPEGDRIGGEIAIHTTQPLYCSRNLKDSNGNNISGTADIIVWHNEDYKIYQVNEYRDYGYYFAIAQRMASD